MQTVTTLEQLHALAEAKPLVIVDCGATWCEPCRQLKPVLEKFAVLMPGITWAYVDVDASPDIADAYAIKSMPTLLSFRKQKLASKHQNSNLLRVLDFLEQEYRKVYA